MEATYAGQAGDPRSGRRTRLDWPTIGRVPEAGVDPLAVVAGNIVSEQAPEMRFAAMTHAKGEGDLARRLAVGIPFSDPDAPRRLGSPSASIPGHRRRLPSLEGHWPRSVGVRDVQFFRD